MNLEQLATFLAVLEQGSFSRAAQVLGVTQSTVSFHVSALEAVAGARLVERGGKAVRTTASGRLLRRYAEKLLALRDEALARLSDEASGRAGDLRVAASTIPGEYLLPPALARVRAKHPGVRIAVAVSDSRRALAALEGEECEVALVGSRPTESRFAVRPFADDEIVLVARPGAVEAGRGKTAARSLAGVPLIVREEGSGTRTVTASVLAPLLGPGRAPALEVGSTEAAKRCALAGLGITLISRHAIEDELASGALVRVPLPGTPVRRRLYVVHRKRAELGAPARTLVSALVRENR